MNKNPKCLNISQLYLIHTTFRRWKMSHAPSNTPLSCRQSTLYRVNRLRELQSQEECPRTWFPRRARDSPGIAIYRGHLTNDVAEKNSLTQKSICACTLRNRNVMLSVPHSFTNFPDGFTKSKGSVHQDSDLQAFRGHFGACASGLNSTEF